MDDSTVRIISGADVDYCLAIRGESIVLARRDPNDHYQNWTKRYVPSKKDTEGHPAFVLFNTVTQQAMWQDRTTNLLFPMPYKSGSMENLWTTFSDAQQRDFQLIRWLDNPNLFLTFGRDYIAEGQMMDLQVLQSKITQRWKFVPPDTPLPLSAYLDQPSVRIYIRLKQDFSLTIRNNTVMLAPADITDKCQHWIKATTYAEHVKDTESKRAFALVNKATGQAIKHGYGKSDLVRLAPFNPNYLDESVLWTEGTEEQGGFRKIRMLNNISLVFDLLVGFMPGRILLGMWDSLPNNTTQSWKIEEL